jgi:predicted regulator of Ras-like GTPase activity (Roadblock/LC7/MglB family)
MLQRLVAGFCKIEGVHGATLLDAQGFHVVGFANVVDFVQDSDNAAICLHMAEAIAAEHKLGNVDQLWFESSNGTMVIANMAAGHTLLLTGDSTPNLGRLRHEVNKARPAFAELV